MAVKSIEQQLDTNSRVADYETTLLTKYERLDYNVKIRLKVLSLVPKINDKNYQRMFRKALKYMMKSKDTEIEYAIKDFLQKPGIYQDANHVKLSIYHFAKVIFNSVVP